MRPPVTLVTLILLFVLAALPMAATFTLFYPDERHYFDGGFNMVRDGDWLIPKHADGTPRFEKPPLAYWAVGASYSLLGVHILSARLPFLLACAGTLWLTWSLARRLTGKLDRAMLAVVVLLAHVQFFLCAIRAMPDALLTFFITLSASGFIRLLILEEVTPAVFWMAYGGAAGAVLSKGLLGVGMVGFAWGFTLWTQRGPGSFKRLLHWPSLLVSLGLATGWFAYIWARYGNSSLDTFFDDQVTSNLHGHWWDPVIRMGEYALVLVANFLPWSLPALELLIRNRFRMPTLLPRRAQAFLLGWTALLVFGFPMGDNVSPRYLLPAAPLIAILLGDWLPSVATVRCGCSFRRILMFLLVILGMLALAGWFFVAQWSSAPFSPVLLFGGILGLLGLLGYLGLRQQARVAMVAVGLSMLLVWLIFFALSTPLYWRETAQQIAATLQRQPAKSPQSVLVVGERQLASRLRTVLGPDWFVAQVDGFGTAGTTNYHFVLAAKTLLVQLPPEADWQLQTVACLPLFPPPHELWEGIKSHRLPEIIQQHGKKFVLATKP